MWRRFENRKRQSCGGFDDIPNPVLYIFPGFWSSTGRCLCVKRLEEIVARLESGEAALDESITLYTQGEALRAQCEARLKDAQARIEKITIGTNGQPSGTTAFDTV